MFEIDSALRTLVERGGSDLHVKVAAPPTIRLHGELTPLEGHEPLTGEETERAFHEIAEVRSQTEFEEGGEADFSYAIPGLSRFRVNAFKQRGSTSIVCRAIPFEIRSVEDLGLPKVVTDLAERQRGIVLVTGTTGSGKSTTLAAMIDHINRTRTHHIVTLEDPIEYLHTDKGSIVNQREVGSDTESFARAMRRVLRQDPDVILIGEMRDEETVRTALSAAETGHLVLSTVHTLDATETINRIIDFFPPHLQHQARVMLSSTLRGAIAQRLVPDVSGEGRVPASEVMVVTGRVQDLILNPDETGKISEVIAEGEYYGMRTFDQSLLGYVMEGKVAEQVALDYASSPHDFKLMLAAGGQHQLEVVRAGGVVERDLLGDLALHHVAEQRLVEGAHPVVLAFGDHLGDLAGLVGVEDQVLDAAGHHHHLGGRHAAFAADVGDEPLGDRAAQGRGEHHAGLVLQVRREEVDDPVDRLGRVEGVDGGEHEVAGLGRREGGANGLLVAHLADQDHVGVLAQVLDRVLEGDDVVRAGAVDVVDHRRQGRRLARAGGARDEDDPALHLGQVGDDLGQAELLDRADLEGDRAADDRGRSALPEGVDAEAREAGDRVGEVGLAVGFELGLRAHLGDR